MAKTIQRKKKAAPLSVGLVALGCAKNTVDLQVMAGHLLKAGFVLAPTPDEADVILVNTCAFIESAREEAAAEILRACALKEAGQCRAVVVTGCFAQRYGDQIAEAFPGVDAVLGIDALNRIAGVMEALFPLKEGRRARVMVPPGMPKRVFSPPMPALRLTGSAFAYLKIAEGCAHRCAYCAIPAIRGHYRSRPVRALVAEARALLETGVRELNIIAQDPMMYGVDLKAGTTLVTLLKALDKLKGDFWIRVLYSYPSEITDDFLAWMNTSAHAVKYIDVPLQHTDPRVLRAMARGGAVKATLGAAERLRQAVPGVTLRTTVMTGFPGETDEAFAKMLMDVNRMAFDHLGAFVFSPEEGTAAAEMADRPSKTVATKRMKQVMAAQRKIWSAKAKTYVGKTFRALVTAPGTARLPSQAPDVDGVVFVPEELPVGTFATVRIVRVHGFDFEAVSV